jgi:hypothetical protein
MAVFFIAVILNTQPMKWIDHQALKRHDPISSMKEVIIGRKLRRHPPSGDACQGMVLQGWLRMEFPATDESELSFSRHQPLTTIDVQ